MQLVKEIEDLDYCLNIWREGNEKIALVPTMGALHKGHLSLIELAKSRADRVIVSIFVNPTQFGENEDFDVYPRTIEKDIELLEDIEVDALFLPKTKSIYPDGFQTYVNNEILAHGLCGRSRPEHFKGVLTIVVKLFNLIRPDLAIFGLKDYQQYTLIKTMVRDLHLNIEILGSPILREHDGLAMSSRNQNLSFEERKVASEIYKSLIEVEKTFFAGERNQEKLRSVFRDTLDTTGRFEVEYVELRDANTLGNYSEETNKAIMLCAARLGRVRLIDNIILEPN